MCRRSSKPPQTKTHAFLVLLLMVLVCGKAAAECKTVELEIMQNVTGKLNTVGPIGTPQTVGEFYGYRGRSSTAPLPMAGRRALVSVHQDTRSCELGLVLVFSAIGQGDALGGAWYYINGDIADPVVKDDPELTALPLRDDSYDDMFDRRKGFTRGVWKWSTSDTDGMAIRILDDWKGCIHIVPIFVTDIVYPNGPLDYNSIDEWWFVGSGGETTELKMNEDLFICINGGNMREPNINPFPRTLTEGNCDELGTYKQPPCGMCERNLCHNHWICTAHQRMNCLFGMDWFLPPTFP